MNNDNPIDRTINDVLGLGHAPQTFSEKIEGLRKTLGIADGHYVDVFRKDKALSQIQGSRVATSASEVIGLYNELVDNRILPQSAKTVFEKATASGGSFYYNEANRSLFYGTGERVTALPLSTPFGGVSFAGRTRKVNSLLNFETGGVSSFIDNYYQGLGGRIEPTLGSLHTAAKGYMSSMLMEGVTTRGIATPEEAFWTSRRSMLTNLDNTGFGMALNKFQTANTAFTMLTRTAGRSIFQPLQDLAGERLDYQSAFGLISRYQEDYVNQLGDMLGDNPTSYVFTKPEYLGTRGKILSSSAAFSNIYGTQFEEGILSKGLFQLAKQRYTPQYKADALLDSGIDPSAPYITTAQGKRDIFQQMKLRVGVVDTSNKAFSQMYFQEGGGILTPTGAKKLSLRAPMGSMKFSSPSEELIGAVERLYGVNMGAGNVQDVRTSARFNYHDYNMARSGGADLTDVQRDIRTVIQASGKQRGLLDVLGNRNATLSKIQLTDSALSMDFTTPGAIVPGSVETVMGGRRFTNVMPGQSHPFKGLLPDKTLEGIDVFIGADEFQKMMGANVYVTNFIEKVRNRDDAEAIFRSTFGHNPHIAVSKKTRMMVPVITNHDDAFRQAQATVASWHSQDKYRELAESIEQGTRIVNDKMLNQGIKGISVYGVGGAVRTDFMGDINMMSPVRITPSKMLTMATGAKNLGYGHAYDDPLFSMFANVSDVWRNKQIGVRAGSGQLFLSSKHMMKRFSRAMLGQPGHIDPSQILTMNKHGFQLGGKQLSRMPGMSAFSHSAGGVDFGDLSNTVLGQANDMLYLDLGKTRKLDILGTGARDYRYLPIPLEYLRTRKGVHNRLMLNESHPAYGLVKTLGDIESNRGFYSDPISAAEGGLQKGYGSVVSSLAGKEGILNKSNTILMPLGTRARLVPQSGDFFNLASMSDAEAMFTGRVSSYDFDDYITRKGGMGAAAGRQARALRRQVAKHGFFYGVISADPMQRSEHANIHKITVDRGMRSTKGIGQLNIELHPGALRMMERDVDRDAINMIPASGMGISDEVLEDRLQRQAKLSRHFMWFQKYELMKEGDVASTKLGGLSAALDKVAGRATDYLSSYLGTSKSLGYSITRASDTIMTNIAAYGVKGARDLGIMGGDISNEMVERIAQPFLDDPDRLGFTQKLLQNIYQGGVQKGMDKKVQGGLVDLAQDLVGIGQRSVGNFDYDAVVGETEQALVKFLSGDGMKERSFMALDYLMENGLIEREGAMLMKADLERGLTEALDQAALDRGAKFTSTVIEAQAKLMAPYLGPGMALAASVKKAPRGPINAIQKMITEETSPTDLQGSILEPAAGMKAKTKQNVFGGSMLDEVADAADSAGNSFFDNAKSFFTSTKGKAFGAGLGVGALVGAGIVSTFGGNEAPMPRPIDNRQPTDMGPEIFANQATIYGNHQSFAASRRRSPELMNSTEPYQFSSFGESSITIRDRSSSSNPYMINRHMRDISNSDYVY